MADPPRLIFQTLELIRQDVSFEMFLLIWQGPLDGIAELSRVRRRQSNVVRRRRRRDLRGAVRSIDSDGGVWIQRVALRRCRREDTSDSLKRLLVADAIRFEVLLRGTEQLLVDAKAAFRLQVVQPEAHVVACFGAALRDGVRVRAVYVVGQEPEEALEVGRDEDVHGWAERLLDAAFVRFCSVFWDAAFGFSAVDGLLLVFSCLPEAVEDVVFVGRDDEFFGGESHAFCEVAGEDVAEVSCRYDEADGGGWEERLLADELEVGVEVVGDLREDAGPVDGIDGGEAVGLVDFRVGKEGFDEVLKVLVER